MSDIRERSIAECPNCWGFITPAMIVGKVRDISGTVSVPVECADCETRMNLGFARWQWDRVVDHIRFAESRRKSRIGRKVAEFRKVDLSVVETVEDIVPFWDVPFGEGRS